jgi:mono/diheme cytochrome c family protein
MFRQFWVILFMATFRMKRFLPACALGLSLMVLSCKDELPTQGSIIFPASGVSYGQHVEPLFIQKCTGCHGSSTALNLIPPSYSSLMNYQPQLVISGQGDNSLLVQLLDGRAVPAMPPTGDRLTDNQINGIKTWINEGALNN